MGCEGYVFCYDMEHMTEINTTHFKEKLETELAKVKAELKTVGIEDPASHDWQASPPSTDDTSSADENEMADRIEEYEDNAGILKELEIQYNEIVAALKRIEAGTYGICEIDGGQIEHERLEANPGATTCMKHMK